MNILILGAGGFIGQHLEKELKKMGHFVVGHHSADGDIATEAGLKKYDVYQFDLVYHLAAKTFVPESWNDTYDYFRVNVMGTVAALEYCRRHKCGIILMSTYVYGIPQYLPISEEHPLAAITPYHETKIVIEHIGRFYSEKFLIPVTIFRPFNVYGPGQNENFLLPKIMSQLLDDNVKDIRLMDLQPKRDYVYIDDVIRALYCGSIIKKGVHVYNIGTGTSYSVEEVVKMCMDVTGIRKKFHSIGEVRSTEISDCVADITKLKEDLGFCIKYTLRDGLKSWFQNLRISTT